jgi:hypothetical protein
MSIETKDLLNAIKRRPVTFGCLFGTLALALTLYFRFSATGEASELLKSKLTALDRLETNIKNAKNLDEHYNALKQINDNLQQSALRADDLAKNLQIFYLLETATGVRLTEIRQQSTPQAAKGATNVYTPLSFSFTAQGSYTQLFTFLKRLERHPVFNRISNGSVSSASSNSYSAILTVEMLALRP